MQETWVLSLGWEDPLGEGMVTHSSILGFPCGSPGKESACNVGDLGSVPGLGRSLGEGNGTALQYSCLENPVDGGAWWAIVHGVSRSQIRLSDFTLMNQQQNYLLEILTPELLISCSLYYQVKPFLPNFKGNF